MATQSSSGAIGRGVRTSVAVIDQLAPGGSLEWTVSGSGLGGIGDLHIFDTLGDGQRMDTVFRPQALIRRGSATLFNGELLGWSGVRGAATAATAINFDLGPTLRAAGLASGLTDDSTVTVTFHSRISSLYAAAQAPPLGRVLGQGDPLRNTAQFSGTVAGTPASSVAAVAEPTLPTSLLKTSIFSVNGFRVVGSAHAAFGDIVTYRMQLELPLTATHHLQFSAAAPGLLGAFVFDLTGSTASPPSGHARFGPDGSYTATAPVVAAATDAAGNAVLRFDFGDIQPVYGNGSGTIDLLVSAPLSPGVPLGFIATETEANSFGLQTAAKAPQAGLILNEPSLRIQTATVYAENDGALWTGTGGPAAYSPDFGQFGDIVSSAGLALEPFADRLSGIGASDEVTFIIAVENFAPGARAYSPMIRATIPIGFAVPADGASLSVTDGAGTPLAYSGNLFDAQGGLTLDAAAPLAGYDADSGLNVLLISYTLQTAYLPDLSVPVHDSIAQIVSYTTEPGWPNRAPLAPAADNTAMTEVATLLPSMAITLVSTGDPGTSGSLLALGETATFHLTATLPTGLSRALDIAALLPAGFAAVSVRVISIGASVMPQSQSADGAGGVSFGDTINSGDGQGTAANQIQIEVVAQPIRTPDGPAPHPAVVQGKASIGAPGSVSKAVDAITVIVADPVPPQITLAFAGSGAPTLLNGQMVVLRMTMVLPAGATPDLSILANLPPGLAYIAGSARIIQAGGVTSIGGPTLSMPAESLRGSLLTLGLGAVQASSASAQVIIELQARLAPTAVGTTLVGSATATTGYASSMPSTLAAVVANTPPALTGLPAGAATRDDTALSAFAGVALADPDLGQLQTLRVQVSNPANGVLTNLGAGSYDRIAGTYTITATAAAVTAAAAALRFMPTLHQAGLGQAVSTNLTIQVQDSAGGVSPATFIAVTSAATDTMPVIHVAGSGQPITPGVPVRLFTGLLLTDADANQPETLTIQFSNPGFGGLRGADPGHFDPATGRFTSTGTLAALMEEAGRLLFTAASGPAAQTFVTVTIDDGAGGVARDTSVVAIGTTAPGAQSPVPAAALLPPLYTSAPANLVVLDPTIANLLTGTSGRDAYFIDGIASGPHWDTLAGFIGGDSVVLWGFQPGRSTLTWSGDGSPGHSGRTLRASIPGSSGVSSLTFAGLSASDTDRFAISTGRLAGLDYLSIAAPP